MKRTRYRDTTFEAVVVAACIALGLIFMIAAVITS
jgi:hypothetical protein